jgi:hypothetical protein
MFKINLQGESFQRYVLCLHKREFAFTVRRAGLQLVEKVRLALRHFANLTFAKLTVLLFSVTKADLNIGILGPNNYYTKDHLGVCVLMLLLLLLCL